MVFDKGGFRGPVLHQAIQPCVKQAAQDGTIERPGQVAHFLQVVAVGFRLQLAPLRDIEGNGFFAGLLLRDPHEVQEPFLGKSLEEVIQAAGAFRHGALYDPGNPAGGEFFPDKKLPVAQGHLEAFAKGGHFPDGKTGHEGQ